MSSIILADLNNIIIMSTLNRPDQQLEEAPNINPQTQISDVPNYLRSEEHTSELQSR